ncbi:MAG TPA: prepilin-type N-terminal cleavage/methylation domain-containing protein [Terriglobales bacterium]|nr:prepilin-type N-terminal cleavage/methylation domain-containing protein [Terriglobales bacterium]
MMASMIGYSGNHRAQRPAERGFSLIEVMISMVVLTVGLISLLGVFGLAMASTQTSQQDMIAKQLANEAYESIVTARNSSQLSWDQIQNNAGTQYCTSLPSPCGIFVGNASSPQLQPIYNAGADGIFGTSDDAAAGEETLQDPGADGIFQTADDTFIPLTGYQRAIQIGPVYDSANNLVTTVRSITITVQYGTSQSGKTPKTYILNTLISQYQ